jgi:hypothetical protein
VLPLPITSSISTWSEIGSEAAFFSSRAEGAQLKYTWKEFEPQKGEYDF